MLKCKACIYYTDERSKHMNGCILYPYKHTRGDDPACKKIIEFDIFDCEHETPVIL